MKPEWNTFQKHFEIETGHEVWKIIKNFWENWDEFYVLIQNKTLFISVDLLFFEMKNPGFRRKGGEFKGFGIIFKGLAIISLIVFAILWLIGFSSSSKIAFTVSVVLSIGSGLFRRYGDSVDTKDREKIASELELTFLSDPVVGMVSIVDQYSMGTIVLIDDQNSSGKIIRYPELPSNVFTAKTETIYEIEGDGSEI